MSSLLQLVEDNVGEERTFIPETSGATDGQKYVSIQGFKPRLKLFYLRSKLRLYIELISFLSFGEFLSRFYGSWDQILNVAPYFLTCRHLTLSRA